MGQRKFPKRVYSKGSPFYQGLAVQVKGSIRDKG